MSVSIDLMLCGMGFRDAPEDALVPEELIASLSKHRREVQYLTAIIKEWNRQCGMPSTKLTTQFGACDQNRYRQAQVTITAHNRNLPTRPSIDKNYYETFLNDYLSAGVDALETTVDALNSGLEVHLMASEKDDHPLFQIRCVEKPADIEVIHLDEMGGIAWRSSTVAAAIIKYLKTVGSGDTLEFDIVGKRYKLKGLPFQEKLTTVMPANACIEEKLYVDNVQDKAQLLELSCAKTGRTIVLRFDTASYYEQRDSALRAQTHNSQVSVQYTQDTLPGKAIGWLTFIEYSK